MNTRSPDRAGGRAGEGSTARATDAQLPPAAFDVAAGCHSLGMRRSRAAGAVAGILLAFGVVLLGVAWADDGGRPVTMLDSGDCWPSTTRCASLVIRPDGTCAVDGRVTDDDRIDLAALCPNGIETDASSRLDSDTTSGSSLITP